MTALEDAVANNPQARYELDRLVDDYNRAHDLRGPLQTLKQELHDLAMRERAWIGYVDASDSLDPCYPRGNENLAGIRRARSAVKRINDTLFPSPTAESSS